MADQNFVHTAEIVKAALPYIDSRSKAAAELFIKVFDLLGSLKSMTAPGSMAACGYESTKFDIEGLLHGIRPVCNDRERDMVDRILNIFNAKKMYEMYNNFMSTMKTMEEFGASPFSNSEERSDQSVFSSQFNGFDFGSIFGNTSKNPEDEKDIYTEEVPTGNPEDSEVSGDAMYPEDSEVSRDAMYPEDSNVTPVEKPIAPPGNNMMFEMLKAMVPPEQMSTFENLSMLLQTMSYDNNSKSDDSKEQDNG